jgi:hypothetical protein
MTQHAPQSDSLDHPVVQYPIVGDTGDFWTVVHERVQRQLSVLEAEVRRRARDVRVGQGRTNGKQFYLFSYRTFSSAATALDPLVSGITFTPAQEGVTIAADISGEQSGDLIFSVPSQTVANQREAILAAAEESARRLCHSADAIAAAIS